MIFTSHNTIIHDILITSTILDPCSAQVDLNMSPDDAVQHDVKCRFLKAFEIYIQIVEAYRLARLLIEHGHLTSSMNVSLSRPAIRC